MDLEKFNLLPGIIMDYINKDGVLYIAQSGTSGYANAAKGYIYDLIKKNIPVSVKTLDVDDSHSTEISGFDKVINDKKNNKIQYNTVIVHSTPNIWDSLLKNSNINLYNKKIIGRTVWEFEKLIPSWVESINNSLVNIVSVPTQWNKDIFEKSGVKKQIIVEPHIYVDYPYEKYDLNHFIKNKSEIIYSGDINKFDFEKSYKFYTIGQFISRKGIKETIECFCQSFSENDNAILLLKTFGLNYSDVEIKKCITKIKEIVGNRNHAPIVYIKDNLIYDEIQSLHDIGNCYFQLTRTEGFGLGIFDAFNKNKQIVVTGYGGHLEYLGKDYNGLVEYEMAYVKDEIFFQFPLDESYHWAQSSFECVKNLILNIIQNVEFHDEKKLILTDDKTLLLSRGWYDLETHQDLNFRWLSTKSDIIVDNQKNYDKVTAVFVNHFTKKHVNVKYRTFDGILQCIFDRICENGERVCVEIPIKDVNLITFESEYFSPYELGESLDRRKLSVMMLEFIFEKDNELYTQSIKNVSHFRDKDYYLITNHTNIQIDTDAYFENFIDKQIYINEKTKHGILLYLPNLNGKHISTLNNLNNFKHSSKNIPIVVYTDGELNNSENYPFDFVKINNLPIMEDGEIPAYYKYATWAFFEGIKIVKSLEWDYFFCYEWDCMVGKDNWYDILWQEHLNWPVEPIMTGTPVFKCPLIGVGDLLQGIQNYRYQYSKECGVYMNVEHVYPFSLYTNGALTFYNTNETARYFNEEINLKHEHASDHMNSITSWDLEIGIRLFKEYGEKSFEKVGWLPSSYSGCGDYFYNQKQRETMITSGLKVAIHQYKYL